MDGDHKRSDSELRRTLQVSHREALTLLSALELSPFDDEVLTQKLLNLVYSNTSHQGPRRPARDFTHHRR